MPTFLDYADITIPDSCRGQSIRKYLSESDQSRYVYTQSGKSDDGRVMITDGTWQLVHDISSNERTYFKRTGDSSEHIEEETVPSKDLEKLQTNLEDHMESFEESAQKNASREEAGISKDVEERLQDLGYKEV